VFPRRWQVAPRKSLPGDLPVPAGPQVPGEAENANAGQEQQNDEQQKEADAPFEWYLRWGAWLRLLVLFLAHGGTPRSRFVVLPQYSAGGHDRREARHRGFR
jgi:hypothetical protein